jgi:hypothetical protein
MHMSNYLNVQPRPSGMATRESGGVGIDHLTVVPENLEIESAAGKEPTAASDAPESAMDADGDES